MRPLAIVTGASRGIGAEYARALGERGYDLLLVSRDKALLDELAHEVSSRYGVKAEIEVMDLAEPAAAQGLFAAARQRRSHVDLLINNAGFGLFGAFVDLPMVRLNDMVRLHVNTVVETMRLFLPDMIERQSGAIINVSSIAGFFSVPYLAEYAATKMFLLSFSEALAEEVRPFGIRIQVCCPGTTDTEFHHTAGFRPKSPLGNQTPAQVVTASLDALSRGRVLVLTGWRGRVLAVLSRCLPRRIQVKIAGRWMHPVRTGVKRHD
jgi:short-subunit dehydrogenase